MSVLASRCVYCGRRCDGEECGVCSTLPASDPLDPLFWAEVDEGDLPLELLEQARKASSA